MVKILKIGEITSEIMLRKGLHFSLYLGEKTDERDQVWSERQNPGNLTSQPSFGKVCSLLMSNTAEFRDKALRKETRTKKRPGRDLGQRRASAPRLDTN